MSSLYEVELEPEVRRWLEGLSDRDFGRVDFLVGMLAEQPEQPEQVGEPYSRHLGGKVRELRFRLLRQQTRVTYWLAPNRRIVLLTVFHKTRSAEVAEVERALQAQETCEARHGVAHDNYEREGTEMSDEHVPYEQIAAARRETAEYREGYDEARRAFLIGQAIRERRLALGLSQSDVAARAGMTQPALSRLEAGGTVPTIPVLERIAVALGSELIVAFRPHAA
jgi:ribosome-binding protein aMBF1 (putative translation factor)/mRNA-degrading endonuclease RelE of RelBE toxin-antitoxin system